MCFSILLQWLAVRISLIRPVGVLEFYHRPSFPDVFSKLLANIGNAVAYVTLSGKKRKVYEDKTIDTAHPALNVSVC